MAVSIAILGAGSWGTAIAIHLAKAHHHVMLWAHQAEHVLAMKQQRQNIRYLPELIFPSTLEPCADLEQCLLRATIIIIAVPSHAFAPLIKSFSQPITNLAWLTKGLDPDTDCLLSKIVAKKFGNALPAAVISGPSFAKEVAQGLPTALVLAGNQADALYQQQLQQLLHHTNMRVYQSSDLIGVQIGGAVKNVLAIASGISDGLGYGANAKAALITRGLAEMTRLGQCLGANIKSFHGLAGLGDLVLTCTDNQSRNRRFGLCLGQGLNLLQAEKHIGQTVEGKDNAKQVYRLAQRFEIDMPICLQVYLLLTGAIGAKQAAVDLIRRNMTEE